MQVPPVRVIVRLPYNRPEQPPPDPTLVSWNSDKEIYLWEVVAKSRGSEGGAPDWKALAARLDVPLPYLLYRAQVRYEQDLRGLQVIKGSLSPRAAEDSPQHAESPSDMGNLPHFPRKTSNTNRRDSLSKLSTSIRLTTPVGVRARLNSLTSNSPSRANRPTSSSVLTLRGHRRDHPSAFQPASPLSSESESDGEFERREEAERRWEEQETLDKKLKHLQTLLTGDNIGLVSSVGEHRKTKEPQTQGRFVPSPSSQIARNDASASSRSQSISSASSPRGSIPSIPSRTPESSQSLTSKHTSPTKSPTGTPAATTSGQTKTQPLLRYGPPVNAAATGSSASSFSDLSEASLNSELESAFSSNIRAGGSRLLHFSPSHILGKGGGRT